MKAWMKVVGALGLCSLLLTGCIREQLEDCPPLLVNLVVKDKNYDNIDHVAEMTGLDERVDESMSFSSYINKIYYAMYRLGETKPFLVEPLYEVTDDDAVHSILFPQNLPFGAYIMMVWANMETTTGLDADGESHTYDMHGGEQEGYDVYMSYDTLYYDEVRHDYTFELERIKGKLLIEAVEMPHGISVSHKTVDNLYAKLDFSWEYSGREQVRTNKHWGVSPFGMVSHTFLAPTVDGGQSIVNLEFLGAEGEIGSLPQPHPVAVTMHRNEITVLRYVYDRWLRKYEIFVLLKDGWRLIHDLGIEE